MALTAQLVIKDLPQVLKSIQDVNEARVKAGLSAAKVEGYRLMQLMKAEIKKGAPGGRPFAPLSYLGRRLSGETRQPYCRTPLRRLAIPVRYKAWEMNGKPVVSVGFIQVYSDESLTTWRRIATNVQEGGIFPVPAYVRRWGVTWGGNLKKRNAPEAKYFFLRKSTTQFIQPSRPIIDPFWTAHESEVARNIKINWVRKMKGERI